MYTRNRRFISEFKGCSPLQLSCNLTGKCHAIAYFSYTATLCSCMICAQIAPVVTLKILYRLHVKI